MLTRAISGAVFVIVMVGSILWGPYSFFLLFAFCTVVGMHELLKALNKGLPSNSLRALFIAIGLIGYAGFSLLRLDIVDAHLLTPFWPVLPALLFLPLLVVLFSKDEQPERLVSHGFLSLIYVALPFTLLSAWTTAGVLDYSPSYLLGGLVIIWTNDTFAYLTGRMLGKHKLFERVSPNKTWEGTIGGIVFSGITATIFGHFHEGAYLVWAGFGVVCAVSAILGDLIESRLKRSLGVKDMGNIMPGHGGILDRFDALLLAAPMGLVYIECCFR